MRSVFWSARRLAGLVLIIILIAPVAVASEETPSAVDADLWGEFLAWVEARLTVPTGVDAADDGFTAWLMARIGIPPG